MINHNQTTLLGANKSEYSQSMSEQQEEAQFRWAERKITLIIETLKTLPHLDCVAEIGCRNGKQAAYYQQQAGIQEMHGFEIGSAPLELASQRGILTHVWISGVSACPVEDNFFDAIIAGDIIEHLVDTDVFLEELSRVVRPGGYILITTPNLAWWWNRMRFLFGQVPSGMGSVSFKYAKSRSVDKKHLRVSVNSEWLYLFSQHGLECISVKGYYYPNLLRLPFRILDNWLTQYPSLARGNLFLLKSNN
jgi:ubiquinone/menaquinone biosynthesis C-methylase UbiE